MGKIIIDLINSINEKCLYRFMLFSGFAFALLINELKILTWGAFLLGFPIAAVLIGSYFWIRLDVWRSEKTIKELSGVEQDSHKFIRNDLISRQVDSRAALIWLIFAAGAQIASFSFPKGQGEWLIFLDILLLGMPITNRIARLVEKQRLE